MLKKMQEVYLGSALAPGEQDTTQASNYLGNWDASTNTPTLVNGVGSAGSFYIVTVAGTADFGAGPIIFEENDWVVYTGDAWVVNKAEGSLINDKTIDTQLTWSSHKINAEIQGLLDDNFISTKTTWSSSKIQQAIETGTSADIFVYKGEVDELPETAVLGQVYKLTTTGLAYWWDGTKFEEFKQDLSAYYTKTETDNLLDTKVDKVAGKGLSTEDFTTDEKTKLAGIETGAEVNNIKSISVNDTEVVPDEDKNVNIVVPTKVSDIENDSQFITKNVDNLENYYNTDTIDGIVSGIGQDINKKQDEITENNKLDYSLLNNTPTKVSDFENDSEFITNIVGNLVNYYKKSETYTQQEINDLIATVESFKIKIVDVLPETDIDTHAMYFVPKSSYATIKDSYDTYIYINGVWELIGSTDINLDDYYTKNETYSQDEVNSLVGLDITKTDANLCVPTEDNTVRYYKLYYPASNVPLNQTLFIQTAKYSNGRDIRITQCAYVNYNTPNNPSFVRTAIGTHDDLTWTEWTQFAMTNMLNKNSIHISASPTSQLLQLTININAYTGGTIQFVSRTLAVYQIRFYRGDTEGIRIRCVAMNNIGASSDKMVIRRKPVVANETSTVLYIKQPNYHTGYNYSVLGLEGTITPSAITTIPDDAVDVPIYNIADSL